MSHAPPNPRRINVQLSEVGRLNRLNASTRFKLARRFHWENAARERQEEVQHVGLKAFWRVGGGGGTEGGGAGGGLDLDV